MRLQCDQFDALAPRSLICTWLAGLLLCRRSTPLTHYTAAGDRTAADSRVSRLQKNRCAFWVILPQCLVARQPKGRFLKSPNGGVSYVHPDFSSDLRNPAISPAGACGSQPAQDSLDDLQSVKLKEPDLDHRVIVTDSSATDADWNYRPDVSDAPRKLSKERSIQLPSFTSALAFSSRSDDLAAALTTVSSLREENGLRIRRESWRLHPFRPSTGESLPSIELGAYKLVVPPPEISLKNRQKRARGADPSRSRCGGRATHHD